MKILIFPGPLPENHREERLPSTALGSLRHAEWRLSAENELIDKKSLNLSIFNQNFSKSGGKNTVI